MRWSCRTLLCLLVLLCAGGCGVQRDLLGAQGEYVLTAGDQLVLAGEPFDLQARMRGGDLLEDKPGLVMLFRDRQQLVGAATTDAEGVAVFRTSREQVGDYPMSASTSPNGLLQFPPPQREFLVACRRADTPILITDIDKTIVASDFNDVLLDKAVPVEHSAEVLTEVAKRYTVVYLTHRPVLFGGPTRNYLRSHNYPVGPLLMSEGSTFVRGSRAAKTQILAPLSERFNAMRYGISENPEDAAVYARYGITPVLVRWQPWPTDLEKASALYKALAALPPQTQLVRDWRQVGELVLQGKSYPLSVGLRELEAHVTELARRKYLTTQPATQTATEGTETRHAG